MAAKFRWVDGGSLLRRMDPNQVTAGGVRPEEHRWYAVVEDYGDDMRLVEVAADFYRARFTDEEMAIMPDSEVRPGLWVCRWILGSALSPKILPQAAAFVGEHPSAATWYRIDEWGDGTEMATVEVGEATYIVRIPYEEYANLPVGLIPPDGEPHPAHGRRFSPERPPIIPPPDDRAFREAVGAKPVEWRWIEGWKLIQKVSKQTLDFSDIAIQNDAMYRIEPRPSGLPGWSVEVGEDSLTGFIIYLTPEEVALLHTGAVPPAPPARRWIEGWKVIEKVSKQILDLPLVEVESAAMYPIERRGDDLPGWTVRVTGADLLIDLSPSEVALLHASEPAPPAPPPVLDGDEDRVFAELGAAVEELRDATEALGLWMSSDSERRRHVPLTLGDVIQRVTDAANGLFGLPPIGEDALIRAEARAEHVAALEAGTTLWIAGRNQGRWELPIDDQNVDCGPIHVTAWEPIGIFDTEEGAVAACARYGDFVAPLPLGVVLPDVRYFWPGMRYPIMEARHAARSTKEATDGR